MRSYMHLIDKVIDRQRREMLLNKHFFMYDEAGKLHDVTALVRFFHRFPQGARLGYDAWKLIASRAVPQ